jgi:hypothetical protein
MSDLAGPARSALNCPGQVREVRQAPAHPMTWVPTRRDRDGGGDHLRVADLPRTLDHLGGGGRPSVEAPRLEPERRRWASASPKSATTCSSALSRAWRPNRSQSSSSDARRLRTSVIRSRAKPSRSLERDARKSGAEWIESVQDRSQTITGTSGTTGPPRLAGHLVRKGGKGVDERARGPEAEQATLAIVVGVDTRLRQCPSDFPCLVGRYDLTSVAAGQPL